MRHPLWILNSSLLVLLLLALGFIFFSRQYPPSREELEPDTPVKTIKKEISKVNITKIYENDLFGTYKKEFPAPTGPEDVESLPEPPAPRQVRVPAIPKPKFLDPLDITLKGIIILVRDDSKNRAIIADNKTNKELTYKVGSTIEDAQLIRILSNKVIFLRSNGQQEVLYLREKDAELDPVYTIIDNWDGIIQKEVENEFTIDVQRFLFRVNNLAQFIDLLDLTTVYKKGRSIGVRVGKTENSTLAQKLGFETGDIIITVQDIPADTTENRFKIYKMITVMREEENIRVEIQRGENNIIVRYTLQAMLKKEGKKEGEEEEKKQPVKLITAETLKKEKIKTLRQKHKFAPTLRDIRKQERRNMLLRGRSPLRPINKEAIE